RPAAVAVAMAGIAVVAVVAVRYWSPAQPPVTVAFVKPPAPAVGQASRPVRQARRPAPLERDALQRQLAPPPAPAVTSPAPAEPAVVAALRKDEAAPLPPPPAQQAAPAPYVQQFAGAASLDGTAGNLSTLNARLLFYG